MKKTIFLSLFLTILLTSCMQVKKIDYTNYSTSFEKTNQDDNTNILDEIYYESVHINSIEDFDKYITNLNNLSLSSYEYIKNNADITEDDVNREINFQKEILTLLKKLTINKNLFDSNEALKSAKIYKNTNIPDIIEARIDYLKLLLSDINRSYIDTKTNLEQIENAVLPLLNSNANITRNKFIH